MTQSTIRSGREAGLAWRSLNPQAREQAWAAARQGSAPRDLAIAYAAAGYGQRMGNRLLVVSLLTPILAIPFIVTALLLLAFSGLNPDAASGLAPVVFVPFAVLVVGLRLLRRRYQRLYNAGLLGVEAHQAGTPRQYTPSAAGPNQPAGPYRSEFTVPYLPPGAQAAPSGPPPPEIEVRMRRRKLLINLAVLAGFGLLIWARVLLADSPSETVLFAVFAVIYSVMIGAFVAIYVLNLANPVLARFTPAGWELPRLRTRGSWSEVRAIRVRAMPTRGGYLRGSGARVVALVVDEPDRYLADASPVWRWLAGRLSRRYGSPLVVTARPGWTVPVVELIGALQRYTSAPVDWG